MRFSSFLLFGLLTGPIYGQLTVRETVTGGDPNLVEIDNQTYNNYAISRLGTADAQIVPKRLANPVRLNLTLSGGAQDMLQLHVGDRLIPETAFNGFSGNYGLGVKLVITDPSSTPPTTTTNKPASQSTASTSTTGASIGGGYGSGGGYGGGAYRGYGSGGRVASENGANTEKDKEGVNSPYSANRIMGTNGPSKKLVFQGAAGVRVRVDPIETKITPPEPPPVQVRKTPVVAKPLASPDVIEEVVQEKKKKDIMAIVIWGVVCATLLGFVVFQRMKTGGRR